jgi:hypothetical protein
MEILFALALGIGAIILGLAVAMAIFVPLRLYQDIKDCERKWHATWNPKWGPSEAPPYPDSDKPMIVRMWRRLRS